MPTVEYHYRRNRDVRLVFYAERWNNRNLKAKGFLTDLNFAKRQMTDLQIKDYKKCKRERFEIYNSWIDLLEDEKRCRVPKSFIKKIELFAKTHPLPGSKNLFKEK